MWYWPVAALLIAQGWKNIDSEVWDSSRLEAGSWMRFKNITLPLLARPMLLAFGVCFVLSMSEFTTFHLAGVETVGTELGVLYELSGSEGVLARAAWPISDPSSTKSRSLKGSATFAIYLNNARSVGCLAGSLLSAASSGYHGTIASLGVFV